MSRRREEHEAPGKDSFLDVVANVVAILIILVMVVGSQAKQAAVAEQIARQTAAASATPPIDVTSAQSAAAAVEASIHELDRKIQQQGLAAAIKAKEREKIQLFVTVAEQRLAEHRNQLDQTERAKYDLQEQLIVSRGELAKLSAADSTLARPLPMVLQHLPTPMAKTVFGTEIHFRLLGGRLAYVPWEEMLAQLKADAPKHVEKLRDSPRVELSLPVVAGFGARYILRRNEVQMQTRIGTATQSRVELEKLYFIDAEPNLGASLAEALEPGSEFRSRISEHKPQNTTVTVWVYPDSFDQFRDLKAELFKLGYLTAGRPLPEGHPIGGSPDGSRSSAE
ncbi:MAG: hypothetical protein L0211_11720 [Planctomycetaceae bacterium]|nr:hypothetical protein [Planctomycetaceae bacterium]